jgi:probable HAF family extracellular repeat protein
VAPTDAATIQGGTRTFNATVTGNANTAVTWTVAGAGNGTITNSGVYTAPAKSGTFQVTARSVADNTKTSTVNVVVGTTGFIHTSDLPGGTFSSSIQALNSNGTVAAGAGTPAPASGAPTNNAAMWRESTGLAVLAGVGPGNVFAMDSTGTTMVGVHQLAGGSLRAYTWTLAGGVTDLPLLAGAVGATTAFDVSGDGLTVVGQGFDSTLAQRAIKWSGGTATNLGVIPGGSFSLARAISGDGNVIVGQSGITTGARAVRWVGANPASSLGVLPGGSQSLANDVNTDGTVIVGESATTTGGSHTAAFRWTQVGGMLNIGSLVAGKETRALGVSGDGTVVVGSSQTGATNADTEAFIWTQAGGMQNLRTYLANRGMATILTGWVLTSATSISTDGKVIGGLGMNPAGQPEGWVALLP